MLRGQITHYYEDPHPPISSANLKPPASVLTAWRWGSAPRRPSARG
jgi:hypothetical protein